MGCAPHSSQLRLCHGPNRGSSRGRSDELKAKPMPCKGRPSPERICFCVVIPTTSNNLKQTDTLWLLVNLRMAPWMNLRS